MPLIIGLGETLFDVYPDGTRRLGGATLNFAVHAHQLQSACGGSGTPVTRTGSDELGREIAGILDSFGVDSRYVQRDPARPTGQVLVTFDPQGSPRYEILEGVAWDAIEFDEAARELAPVCDAVCFGTLAQRDLTSRATIQAFVEAAPQALRLCDINLRQQFFSAPLIRRSLELANAVKLNDEELSVLSRLLDLEGDAGDRITNLIDDFRLDYLVLTRGERGTAIYTRSMECEGDRVSLNPAPDADAVGAGDACAAAVAVGLMLGHPPAAVATFANRIGAYVASQPGGTPRLPDELRVKPDCTLPV